MEFHKHLLFLFLLSSSISYFNIPALILKSCEHKAEYTGGTDFLAVGATVMHLG